MQTKYRDALPQLAGELYLTDAGLETDLIFNKGIDITEFAAHTLLTSPVGRLALIEYLNEFLALAENTGAGFILDAPTWKAHMHWASDLNASEDELRRANHEAVSFIACLRDRFMACNKSNSKIAHKPIVLNGLVGPRGDAYAPEHVTTVHEAEQYHARQISWLAETDIDMVSAMTFTQSEEAIGVVRAATNHRLPVVVSFTVETNGHLPSGQSLGDAIDAVDAATNNAAAYFMVNCAHPEHFAHTLHEEAWPRRIHGLRCNASRMSHTELDCCDTLDDGNPQELAQAYRRIKSSSPWLNVFGGCCGSDLRHVTAIATAMTSPQA